MMSDHDSQHDVNSDDVHPVIVYSRSGKEGQINSGRQHEQPTPLVPRASRYKSIGCFLLLAVALQVAFSKKIMLSQWTLSADGNAAVAEGEAWLHHRLDIPAIGRNPADPFERSWDTAYIKDAGGEGRCYNVFPPLISGLTYLLHPLHEWLGVPEGHWSSWTYVWLIYWPLILTGFLVFRSRVGDPAWAAFLTFAWIGGTALLPNLDDAGRGLLGQLNHVISQIGLLIFAAELLGKQRTWPALIGLAISTYTRQLSFLYGAVLICVAWRRGKAKQTALAVCGLAMIAAPLLWLNQAKFGNPLDFGYEHIYVGRDGDFMAKRVKEFGLFSPHYIRDNAYYIFAAPPQVADFTPVTLRFEESNPFGTGVFITTPLALLALIMLPNWWRNHAARLLMLGTLPIILGLLCYHSPGWVSQGYSRFALDFLPIWLVVVAPWTRGRWQTPVTLACVAWSCWYFQNLVA